MSTPESRTPGFWDRVRSYLTEGSRERPVQLAPMKATREPPQELPSWFVDAVLSSFVQDTLLSLLGRPPVFEYKSDLGPGVRGLHTGNLLGWSKISLSDLAKPHLRTDLAHEVGHAFDLHTIDGPRLDAIMAVRDRFPVFRSTYPLSYASTHPEEHFATVFSNAISLLARFSDPLAVDSIGMDAESIINQAEQADPGTGVIMRYLLTQPIYADHPLNTRRQ